MVAQVGSLFTKATPILKAAKGYAKRGTKVYLPTVFGNGQEVMTNAYKNALTTKNPFKGEFWRNLWKGTKEAGKAAEKSAAAIKGGFLKNTWKSIASTPKKIAQGWKVGGYLAKKGGKNVLMGKLGGALKGIGKKMPLIGSLLLLAFELPNIIKATKNEGIVQGLAETAKAGARLGGATLGAAVGTALGGPIGGFVGWIAGEWLAGKIVGKSYSERKAKQEEKIAQAIQQNPQEIMDYPQTITPNGSTNNPYISSPFYNPNINPQQLAYLEQQLYGNGGIHFDTFG